MENNSETKPKKSKQKKCVFCNKRQLIIFKCEKCNKNLCLQHFCPEEHKCEYDYKKDYKELIKIEASKVEIL